MNKYLKKIGYILGFVFLTRVVIQIDFYLLLDLISLNKSIFVLAFVILSFSQLSIGIIWSSFIRQKYGINFKHSFQLWHKSIAAKYIPGKIASPILRIESKIFKNNKLELFNHIIIETLLLLILSIFIGSYIFFNSIINFFWFLIILNCIFFCFYKLHKYKLKKIDLSYFKNIFYLEISSFLNIVGVFLLTTVFNIKDSFELTLIYVFVSGISMMIFVIPAGIGIRENFFIQFGDFKKFDESFLAPLSLALRVCVILVDVIFLIVSLIYYPYINRIHKKKF